MDIVKSLPYPEEVLALLRFKTVGCEATIPKYDYDSMTESLKVCMDLLVRSSRSFAAVIQALDPELRPAMCIFYLVLRALDTVEDDMSIPMEKKVPMLKNFHENLLNPDWKFMDSQDKDAVVLEKFPNISKEFRALAEDMQEVIKDKCARMGSGMAKFLESKVHSWEDWDEYCFYVAGLVGIGMAGLFYSSGLEEKSLGHDEKAAINLGLLLQKTNIIRDYLEDLNDKRIFWPLDISGKYRPDIADFAKPRYEMEAVACLNELVTNALQHIDPVLDFLSRTQNQSVFNFTAIPQVMAIATLERCYNNPSVFKGVVKIRKGEAIRMMMYSNTFEQVKGIFRHYVLRIQDRIPDSDPNAMKTRTACRKALALCSSTEDFSTCNIFPPLYLSMGLMVSALAYTYWSQISQWYEDMM